MNLNEKTKPELAALAVEKKLVPNKTAGMKMAKAELLKLLEPPVVFHDHTPSFADVGHPELDEPQPEVFAAAAVDVHLATGIPLEMIEHPEDFSGVPLHLPEKETVIEAQGETVPAGPPPTPAERLAVLQKKLAGLPAGIPYRAKKERELQKKIRQIGKKLVAQVSA